MSISPKRPQKQTKTLDIEIRLAGPGADRRCRIHLSSDTSNSGTSIALASMALAISSGRNEKPAPLSGPQPTDLRGSRLWGLIPSGDHPGSALAGTISKTVCGDRVWTNRGNDPALREERNGLRMRR